ncbi:MAG: GMC family oxidoreductase [Candidatus Latescibacterota bacterium]|nr:GMC family oxidoreductase [Candidatus Latescibacterota bacterium]
MSTNLNGYDAVVVGSGFGGALVAHALLNEGRSVLVLERGRWPYRDSEDWDQNKILLEQRYKGRVPTLVRQYGSRNFSEIYANEVVGGKSVFYGGASLRLRENDFTNWPFSYDEFAVYYEQAENLLGVHGCVGSDPCEPPGILSYPFEPIDLTAPAQRIAKAGIKLGLHPFSMPLAINFNDSSRPQCQLCNTCDGFPCQIEAKNDVATTFLKGVRSDALTVKTNTIVERVHIKGKRASAVEYIDKTDGKRCVVEGDVIVLAAGAIQSPALLKRSEVQHPLIGRFLMRHCNAVCSYVFPFPTNPEQIFHKQLCFSDYYEDMREDLGTAVGVIQDIYTPAGEVISHHAPVAISWFAGRLANRIQNLLCVAEDDGQISNNVSLSSRKDILGMPLVQIEHEYSHSDMIRRNYLVKRARRILRKAGGLLSYTYPIDSFSHAVGTLRSATTSENGALDPQCRVWSVDNLFVVDGSFMPSSGGVNPSLTIAANALRVAKHIVANGT